MSGGLDAFSKQCRDEEQILAGFVVHRASPPDQFSPRFGGCKERLSRASESRKERTDARTCDAKLYLGRVLS